MPDPLSYKDAGVDIDKAARVIENIGPSVKKSRTAGVYDDLGGFGGMFRLFAEEKYEDPILVSGTDGVGTKLLVSEAADRFDGLGQDLVAMCANDILCTGARPLFFLDYYATSSLEEHRSTQVISGIADACTSIGCALIGGEIAEMPGVYPKGGFDLAGFCVGVVERQQVVSGQAVCEGDIILGLPSSGVHSNGLSLARKIIAERLGGLESQAEDRRSWAEILLTPTTLYESSLRPLLDASAVEVRAMSHITGGGITENLTRGFPEGLGAEVRSGHWTWPSIFHELAKAGDVSDKEMLKTFNCGIGFCVVVPNGQQADALALLNSGGRSEAVEIGRVVDSPGVQYLS